MFSGIIEEVGQVMLASEHKLTLAAQRVLKGMKPGDSIAINGTCLTVTGFDSHSFSIDIMEETLKRTNLGRLKPGDRVNLESALTLNKPLGGHLVQGHIDATGRVESIKRHDETTLIRVAAPPEVMRYVVEKGFIALDGISLTVIEPDKHAFSVSIVNFTLQNTTLGQLGVGAEVNLEADIIAKYVDRLTNKKNAGINLEFLKEHGFISG